MAKSKKQNADNVVPMPMAKTETVASSESIDRAIAHRAFELFCDRGHEHGHDVDDWLEAERQVRQDVTFTAA